MQFFAVLGTLAFVLTGAVVGARLLLLARRTREKPEFFIGCALFAYSVVTQPAIASSRYLSEAFGREVGHAATSVGLAGVVVCLVCLYLFNWNVFRRESTVARMAVWLSALAALGSTAVVIWQMPMRGPGDPYGLATKLAIVGLSTNFASGMAWAGIESLGYYARLRRRLALGLAEPVLVNRFLLWGIGCSVTGGLSASTIVCVAAGMNIANDPVPLMLTALSGTISAVCWWLTFLAPASYTRWVAARADAR